jgi:hypothetical protein
VDLRAGWRSVLVMASIHYEMEGLGGAGLLDY